MQNSSTDNGSGDNKNNDDGSDDSGKPDPGDSSGNPDPDDTGGAKEQPKPDDDRMGDNRSKADKAGSALLGKRGYTPPAEKIKGVTKGSKSVKTKMNAQGNTELAPVTGTKTMFDHTAGDGSGTIDPNQPGKGTLGTPPTNSKPERNQFDGGNLTGEGFGHPDAAR